MSIPRTREAYLEDQATMKRLAEADPHFAEIPEPANFTAANLKKVGITHLPELAGDGYIKLHQEDFIVEELTLDGRALTISPDPQLQPEPAIPGKAKVWATVIKRGMGTPEAGQVLATKLGVTTRALGWAGLKDGQAVTAQEFSFMDVDMAAVQNLSIPHLLVKDVRLAPGMLQPGQLWGNRFTLYIRTGNINPYTLSNRVEEIKQKGILNFFSLQRFGTRLNGHDVGRQVLLGNYEEAVRIMVSKATPHESLGLGNLRSWAGEQWGDWQAMINTLGVLPNYFHDELSVLHGLQNFRGNYARALGMAQEEIKLCVYGYFSYCFNQALSILDQQGERPEALPQLSSEPFALELYAKLIPAEPIARLDFNQQPLPFLRLRPRTVETVVMPSIHSVLPGPQGHIFHFDLPKGAYATSFLSQVLNIYQGRPVPEWVGTDPFDSRAPLGYPSINLTTGIIGNSYTEKTELPSD